MSIMDQIHDMTRAAQVEQNNLMSQYNANHGDTSGFQNSRFDQMTMSLSNIYGYLRTQGTDLLKTMTSRLEVSNKLIDELIDITSNYYGIMRKESASKLIKSSNEQLIREITLNDQKFYNQLSKEFSESNKNLNSALNELINTNKNTKNSLDKIIDKEEISSTNTQLTQISSSLKQLISIGLKSVGVYSAAQLDKRYDRGTSWSQAPSGALTKVVRTATDKIASLSQSISGLTSQLVSNVTPALYRNSTYQQLLSTYGTEGMTKGATIIRSVEDRANELRKQYDISLEDARGVAIREASGTVTQNGKEGMPEWYTQSSSLDRKRQFEEQQIIESENFSRLQAAQTGAFTNFRGADREAAIPLISDIKYMMPGLAAEASKLFQSAIRTNASSAKDIYDEIAKVTRNMKVDATTLQSVGDSYTLTLRQLTGKNADLFDKKMKSLIKTTGMLEDSFIDATSIFDTVDDLAYTSLADMSDTQLTTIALQAREAGMSVLDYQKHLQTDPEAALTMINANKGIASKYDLNREDGLSQRELIFGNMILGVNGRQSWDQYFQQTNFDPTKSEQAYQEDQGTNYGDFTRELAIASREFADTQNKNREWFQTWLDETFLTKLDEKLRDQRADFLKDPELYQLALDVEDSTLGAENIGTAAKDQIAQANIFGTSMLSGLEWVANFVSMKLVDSIFGKLGKSRTIADTASQTTAQSAKEMAEAGAKAKSIKNLTPGGVVGGALPGASLLALGGYGAYRGWEAHNEGDQMSYLGNEEGGSRHKAIGTGTAIAGVGTGLLAAIPAFIGGGSAALGGASFGGAALAGLASVPVIGWVAAAATAVGITALEVNKALTKTNGAIQFIDNMTDEIARTNAELSKTNSEYYEDLKLQIDTSTDLRESYNDLQSQGIIPASISFEDLSNGLNINKEELAKVSQGLSTTDETLSAFRNLGIDPTTEEFKSLWDPSTGALVATQEKLKELYGESGALTLMAISTGDATSALSTFVDAANIKSEELLGISSSAARNAGARINEWSDSEKVDANKSIYDEFIKIAENGVLDRNSNSYEYHKWAGFLRDLESTISDESQRSNYSKMVESILSNDKISKEEMAAAFDQGGAGANLRSFFSFGIDRESALTRQEFDPSKVAELARSMNIQGVFKDTSAGQQLVSQIDQLTKIIGSGTSTSTQKSEASSQLLEIQKSMEQSYPELAKDYKSLFEEVSNQSNNFLDASKLQSRAINDQTDTLSSDINDIKKILNNEEDNKISKITPKLSNKASSGVSSYMDRTGSNSTGGNPFYGWRVSSAYGPRTIDGKYDFHTGVDFPQPSGTPIPVPISGTVSNSGWQQNGYGNWVDLQGDNGYTFKFAHMVKPTHWSNGSKLSAGQPIGYIGTTGWSTGNHLHFEVHDPNGTRMDPQDYLSGLPALGSHRAGLSNVPYDGYIAELHKDERVLTSDENLMWQKMLSERMESPADYQPVVDAIEVLTNIVSKIYDSVNKPTSRLVEQDPSPAMVRQSNLINSYA